MDSHIDAKKIKAAATGRWPEILTAVGGIDAAHLDGKHHPCPKCGGTDRFRLIDAAAGVVLCNQCFNKKSGDGLAAIAWARGLGFADACREVAAYLGLKGHRPPSSTSQSGSGKIVANYDYCNEGGEVLFQVVRYDPKDFKQRRPNGQGGWIWGVKGIRVIPFKLPSFIKQPTSGVVVVEGEKDVINLARIGILATCNAGGAEKWTSEHAQFLLGRDVAIIADNDEKGRSHAEQVARSLQGIAKFVRIVELPGLPEKGDVSDWLAAGGTKEKLIELIRATPLWQPRVEWPELEPFETGELPEFPTEALAPVLRDFIEALALATQTPADLPGLLVLAVVSATIARRVVVEPWPGWRESCNLYVTVLMEPANRKSAVFTAATAPLRELEAELIEEARPQWAREWSQRRQSEGKLRKLEKIAAEKLDAKAGREACDLAERLAKQPEPTLPRLLVDDATSEKLGMILAEQGGRIASMSPEGSVFDLMAGMYSKNGMPQFDVYIKGHSGDDLVTDRVSRKSVRVERPALTCAYAMQPQVIEGLADKSAFRGRGLLARYAYAAPRSLIGERQIAPPPVSPALAAAYSELIWRLGSDQTGMVLRLSAEAESALRDWEEEIERMLAEGGQMELIRDWGGKLVGTTLRLAAVLHVADRGTQSDIGPATLAAAVKIARYLIPHAEAVLTMMQAHEKGPEDDAQYLLRWIVRLGKREFTKTEAQHHGKRRFPKADEIDPALAELVRRGYIRQRPAQPSGPGRPPSPQYEINSAVLSKNSTGEAKAQLNNGNIRSASEQLGVAEGLPIGTAQDTATLNPSCAARRPHAFECADTRSCYSQNPSDDPTTNGDLGDEAGEHGNCGNSGSAPEHFDGEERTPTGAPENPTAASQAMATSDPAAGGSARERSCYSQNPDCQSDQGAKQPEEVNNGNCGSAPTGCSGEASQKPALRPAADSDHGADWTEFEIL